jgi:hypothetical protein
MFKLPRMGSRQAKSTFARDGPVVGVAEDLGLGAACAGEGVVRATALGIGEQASRQNTRMATEARIASFQRLP